MLIKNKNNVSTIGSHINTSKIPDLVKRLSAKARKTPILFVPILIGASTFSFSVNGAEAFVEAAENTVSCRDIADSEDRLSCFESTTKRLAELMNPTQPATKLAEAPNPE